MIASNKRMIQAKFLVRVILSTLLLGWILHRLDIKVFLSSIKLIPLSTLIGFFIATGISQFLGAIRWWLLARIAGFTVGPGMAVRSFFLGTYVNLIGLGTVGGDIVRGTIIGNPSKKIAAGIICAFSDRLIGLLVLLCCGFLGVALFGNDKADFKALQLLSVLGLTVIGGWLICPRVLMIIFPKKTHVRERLEEILSVFTIGPKALSPIVFMSVLYHLIQIFLIYLLACRLNSSITFSQILTSVPFINILVLLPISWNGIGVRESAFLFFFTPDLLSIEQATTLSLLWFFSISLVSIFGGATAMLHEGSFPDGIFIRRGWPKK